MGDREAGYRGAQLSRLDVQYLNDVLKRAVDFHGHLGPFLVIGVQMGLMGRRFLKNGGAVVVKTGDKPPLSCVIDGIQASSGYTVGRGDISIVKDFGEVSALFKGVGVTFKIKMKDHVLKDLLETIRGADSGELETIAGKVMEAPIEDMFIVE